MGTPKGKKMFAQWIDEGIKERFDRYCESNPINKGDLAQLGAYLAMRLKPNALHEAYRAMSEDDPEFVIEGFRLAEGTTGQAHTEATSSEAERVVEEEVRRSRGGRTRHTDADRGTG